VHTIKRGADASWKNLPVNYAYDIPGKINCDEKYYKVAAVQN
jgi:hypothetical protein